MPITDDRAVGSDAARRIRDPDSPRVAFQGERGAYSESGVIALWQGRAIPVPCREFIDVARAVAEGAVEYGLLPIENTLAGSVLGSYDAIGACPSLHAVAQVVVPIHHCVLGMPGARLEELESVESHPVALAQCVEFLRRNPHLEARAAYDTAGAARDVARRADPRAGAIAGRIAAERFGLAVLAENVEDRPDNQTRFLALTLEPEGLEAGVPAQTAVHFITDNAPGALYRVLGAFAERGLNLSRMDARPTGEPWEYAFFVEVEHDAGDPRLGAALDDARSRSSFLRVIGTYAVVEARSSDDSASAVGTRQPGVE